MKKEKKKEKYQKPELKTIELQADEVLAAGCKTYGSSGLVGNDCGLPLTGCSANGS